MTAISVVIPTMGDRLTLNETLASLARQTLEPQEVIVVNQGAPDLVDKIAAAHPTLNLKVVRSPAGLARARNRGIKALSEGWDFVATPDDDIILSNEALEQLAKRALATENTVGAVSGCLRSLSSGESRLNFASHPQKLNRNTVWTSAIEAAMVYSRAGIHQVGLFDETLGLGSGTPWGSGEGTDLLLRLLEAGYEVWYEPIAQMTEVDSLAPGGSVLVKRARSYARGTGRVFALRETRITQGMLLTKSLLKVFASLPSPLKRRTSLAVLCGRWEGLRGRIGHED